MPLLCAQPVWLSLWTCGGMRARLLGIHLRSHVSTMPSFQILSDLAVADTRLSGHCHFLWGTITREKKQASPSTPPSAQAGLHGSLILSSILGWPQPSLCPFPKTMMDRQQPDNNHPNNLPINNGRSTDTILVSIAFPNLSKCSARKGSLTVTTFLNRQSGLEMTFCPLLHTLSGEYYDVNYSLSQPRKRGKIQTVQLRNAICVSRWAPSPAPHWGRAEGPLPNLQSQLPAPFFP